MPRRAANLRIVLTCLLGSLLMLCAAVQANGDSPSDVKADSLVRFAIFGGKPLVQNSEAALERILALPREQQFGALAEWVLPGLNHSDLRVTGRFVEADQIQAENDARRIGQRGPVESPAIALVDVAAETGRLDELRSAVESLESLRGNSRWRREYGAFRFLISVARGDDDAAEMWLSRLFDLFVESPPSGNDDRWPEMVAIEFAMDHASTRQIARELLARMFEIFVDDAGGWRTQATPEWTAHFLRQLATAEADQVAPDESAAKLVGWKSSTLEKARTAGGCLPKSQWRVGSENTGEVRRTIAHEDDLLFFEAPLQGDFEVQCDLKPYVWHGMQLLLGGRSFSPDGDRFGLDVRGIRSSELRHVGLTRQLSVSDEWAHVRAVVRGGECRLYFDGRLVETRRVNLQSVPWLALRNPVPHRGAVRDVRISGQPNVPREVTLAADENLAGWYSWYEHDDSAWRQNRDWPRVTGIERDRLTDLSGAAVESLLRYYRPMFEDGTIEYEFLYEPGQLEVHPVLGRTAVLLQPDGIALHRVTSGYYESSDLTPDNSKRPADDGEAPRQLRLLPGQWNQVRLKVADDTLQVVLNGEQVYEAAIADSQQRTFGLFHWADQSSVRVRNVIWRGDWGESVPDVDTQELADPTVAMLDQSTRHLTAQFEHDFAEDGFPGDLFVVRGSDQEFAEAKREDGFQLTRPIRKKGYVDAWLALRMRVSGDFDVEAEFHSMSCNLPVEGWQGINLEVVTEDEGHTHCRVFRGSFFNSGKLVTDLVQTQIHRRRNGQYRALMNGSRPEESAAGRLRIARRGEKLYFLFAQQDSTQFRLLHEEVVSDADLLMEGIRLRLNAVSETDGEAKHSVAMKSITVRAESISGLPITNHREIVAELDSNRDELTQSVGGELNGKAAVDGERFSLGTVVSRGDDGLRVIGVGRDRWTSSRVGYFAGVAGDFDVSATFKPTVLDDPADGQNSTIYLRGMIPAPERTSADVILVRHPDGRQTVLAEFVTFSRSGLKFRDVGVREVKSVERLRLVRRGTQLTFLFAESESDDFQVLAQTEVSSGDLGPRSFRFEVHAGGEGKRAIVDLKEFTLRAKKLFAVTRSRVFGN